MRGPEVGAGGRLAGHASPAWRPSFQALFRDHEYYIFSLIYRRIGNRETAAELAQEVFLKAFLALDRYRPLQPIRAWLTEIAKNQVFDYFRKKKITTIPIIEGFDIPEPGFYTELEQKDMADRALKQLPDDLRVPLVMRIFGGLTYEDISEALDIPASTLRVRIYRAKDSLREILASLN